MKAKLYKGPLHGKTYEVQEGQRFIEIAIPPKKRYFHNFLDDTTNPMAMMPAFKTGRYRRTHHTHPDGSVFFVYEG